MLPRSFPSARVSDPHSVPSLRWGILGAGGIAEIFADAVHSHTGQRITAVASATPGKAEAFALSRDIPHVHSSYQELVSRSDIDVVYVATTHQFHTEHALLALAAGKHVLVEKPFATNPEDVLRIQAAATQAGVLAMEAMWTNYLPQADVVRQLLTDGALGDISLIVSDFGQELRHVPRLQDPALGGGLLDLGIYNFAFSSMVLGSALRVNTVGTLTPSGVDETTTSVLEYPSGARSIATVSIAGFTPTTASISGDTAQLRFASHFFTPTTLTLHDNDFDSAVVATWSDETGIHGHAGLSYQATALASFVEQGLQDSPLRPLATVATDIDLIRSARHHVGAYLTGESR